MKSLISLVSATFNVAKYLPGLINSLRVQTDRDFEWIVIDGASVDGTIALVESAGDIVTKSISEPDTGIYQAWNKALAHAKGEWLLFLGADDRLADPHVMKRVAPYLQKAYPRYRVVYGKINLLNTSGGVLRTLGYPWKAYKGKYEHGRVKLPPHPGTFLHKSLFEKRGFDESLRIAGDSEFLIRELKQRPALYIPEVITNMNSGGISGSPENTMLRWRECRTIMKRHQLSIPFHILAWQWSKSISEFILFSIFPNRMASRLANIFLHLRGRKRYHE